MVDLIVPCSAAVANLALELEMEDLLEDRIEYSLDDIEGSYPFLNSIEAKTLILFIYLWSTSDSRVVDLLSRIT